MMFTTKFKLKSVICLQIQLLEACKNGFTQPISA